MAPMANPSKKNTTKNTKDTSNFRKYIVGFWTLFGAGILALILLFLLAGWGAFGKMPKFEELENPETNLATEIFSSDGETLGKYYSENRTPIKYDDLPDQLIEALVATEDERYYKHSGIDAQGTLRAAIYLGSKGGASTITQQLAKLLFTQEVSQNFVGRVMQKFKEYIIAIRLERQYTKEEIITMYFNKYDFIYQAVGIRSASKIYFNKEAKDLKLEESAVLVAMLKNSALYNPVRRPELVEQRRNQVFKQMEKNGFLTIEEKDSLQQLPMKITFTPQGHDEGIATYFRVYLQGFMKDWIEKNPKPDGSSYNKYYKSFLQAGMMSMTPQTGEVKAWVGGIDFKSFKFEHVKQARRQVGSTFKPFVYATAIDQLKLSPCDTLPRNHFTIEAGKMGAQSDWSPANSDDKYDGMMTLKSALANSVNTISARLIAQTGPRPVIELLNKLGVETKDIPAVPSIALGTADMSLFEMVSAYSTFANEGVYVKPVIVNRIEDKNGTVLYQHVPDTKDVLSKETAYVTVNLMEGVTQFGTGTRLRGNWAVNNEFYKNAMTGYPYDFKNPIAGKTGTTQNQSDGWFMGMVPNLVTGVWVGGEDRAVHFPGIQYGQGATMALPIWGMYMKDVYTVEELGVSSGAFPRPENLSIEINCDTYKRDNNDSQSIPDELEF